MFLHMYTAAAEAETQVTFADDVNIIQGLLALEMRHKLASVGLFSREISQSYSALITEINTFNVPRQVL